MAHYSGLQGDQMVADTKLGKHSNPPASSKTEQDALSFFYAEMKPNITGPPP